jgi:hypothetical protein
MGYRRVLYGRAETITEHGRERESTTFPVFLWSWIHSSILVTNYLLLCATLYEWRNSPQCMVISRVNMDRNTKQGIAGIIAMVLIAAVVIGALPQNYLLVVGIAVSGTAVMALF